MRKLQYKNTTIALNGQITYYGSTILRVLTVVEIIYLEVTNQLMEEHGLIDAQLITLKDLTKNLIGNEYMTAGHDQCEFHQTISGYLSLIIPDKKIKLYMNGS